MGASGVWPREISADAPGSRLEGMPNTLGAHAELTVNEYSKDFRDGDGVHVKVLEHPTHVAGALKLQYRQPFMLLALEMARLPAFLRVCFLPLIVPLWVSLPRLTTIRMAFCTMVDSQS